jgi:hypothetical protein
MIRRDYILRMIEECIRALAGIAAFKQEQRWDKASEALNGELQRLVGSDAQAIASLSETDLLARLMREGPTHTLREKTLILTTLLKEAGDLAAAKDQNHGGREYYFKALHLLLDILNLEPAFECPEFVPKVEMLVAALQSEPMSVQTQARLMQHYERTGAFARAEDALFAMLDSEPDNPAIVEFGIAFYQRLLTQSDAVLIEGELPRVELDEGLKELQARRR